MILVFSLEQSHQVLKVVTIPQIKQIGARALRFPAPKMMAVNKPAYPFRQMRAPNYVNNSKSRKTVSMLHKHYQR
jgi:hypothetical protein